MSVFMFVLGVAQCLLLWALGQTGLRLVRQAARGHEMARYTPPAGWPPLAVIIPVGGSSPLMERALRSLLEQDYPDYGVLMVCATESDAAMPLVTRLTAEYARARYVLAGAATACGQKNYNLLAGARAAAGAAILVFCDSTHVAAPDFLRCLADPIARGECAFATGYHQVLPQKNDPVTLAYTLSVLFMRFLQGTASLTQLWGGAMAMSRDAFNSYGVARLWAANVVDDCSLSAWLQRAGTHVRLCPAALLATYAGNYSLNWFRAWLGRQILFLKFCMPGQWLLLGLASFLMAAPVIWGSLAIGRSLAGAGSPAASFLALCWLCLLAWAIWGWRKFIALPVGIARLLCAFFCAALLFALGWAETVFTQAILWQNIVYTVGKNGVVRSMRKMGS